MVLPSGVLEYLTRLVWPLLERGMSVSDLFMGTVVLAAASCIVLDEATAAESSCWKVPSSAGDALFQSAELFAQMADRR